MTTQTVVRDWQPNRNRVAVSTQHPDFGPLFRGTIRAVQSGDWRGVWSVVTYDHEQVDGGCTAGLFDGYVVGDYLDAEAVLLAATSALDA